MFTFFNIVVAGFILGIWHAKDADHVVAISTIVARERSVLGAARIGALWGLGHTLTITAVGGAIILFSVVIPKHLEATMEMAVGVMLILLGVMNLSGFTKWLRQLAGPLAPSGGLHLHIHNHGDFAHTHFHGHDAGRHGHDAADTPLSRLDQKLARVPYYSVLRPLVVGIVHGLAGSAAIALLVLAAVTDAWLGVAYLLVFGLGSIIGMVLISTVLAAPLAYSMVRFPRFGTHLRIVSGLVSMAFGVYVIVAIGWGDGLFADLAGRAH
jgi:high-affinity nickel-transport protein